MRNAIGTASSLLLSLLSLLSGCVTALPPAPSVLLSAPLPNSNAWHRLGFDIVTDSELIDCPRRWYETGDVDCVIRINVTVSPDVLVLTGSEALANRADRWVAFDTSLTGQRLDIAVAHELGHILLDTPKHTAGGVMGGSSAHPTAVDYELACESIGVCVEAAA